MKPVLRTLSVGLASAALLSACTTVAEDDAAIEDAAAKPVVAVDETEDVASIMADYVMMQPFEGPYGGVPAFDQVEISDFEGAMTAAIAEGLDEIRAITVVRSAPTFENTIIPLEKQGGAVARVSTYYGIWSSTLSTPEFREIEPKINQMVTAYENEISQNESLFQRIRSIYTNQEMMAALEPAEQRLVWDYYTDFVRAGAALEPAERERVAELNTRMGALQTQFRQNLLADEQNYITWLSEDQLGGLPSSVVSAAASAAEAQGRSGEYAILNTRSSMDPFLRYSTDRGLRESVWRTYYSRGDNGDANDNNAIITELLRLREERSRLLGYDTYADYALEKRVAQTPERAMELLMTVWPAATARVAEEVADMQAIADAEGAEITIEPWDYRFYAEKVRKDRYDLDFDEVKGYLQLENLREGMFWMAGELFELSFTEIDDVPVYHPDVRVWKVMRGDEYRGLFYFDPFARTGKRSGAWMNTYRAQSALGEPQTVIVSNNSNFIKTAPGEPVLISWDDATTLYHEFGHALHGLLSEVTYPGQCCTRVARDYVEFPSQVIENWLATPEILNQFALHYETGEPMPAELLERVELAATFNQGFATTEYLASALIDQALHSLDDASNVDPDLFERETLAELGMPDELPMRHRTPQFAHVFASEGYAAQYYAYLWADTFSADAWEAFEVAPNGVWDRDTAASFNANILAVGDTIAPQDGYKGFRGRDPDVGALMRQRGFSK